MTFRLAHPLSRVPPLTHPFLAALKVWWWSVNGCTNRRDSDNHLCAIIDHASFGYRLPGQIFQGKPTKQSDDNPSTIPSTVAYLHCLLHESHNHQHLVAGQRIERRSVM
ncbi:hypothetical protein BDW22DRAFT_981048 [Trametopsis cervina]|nr:hypothetical protein BDW22DRAFT_981048 [Trametopsis cervina]